MTTRFKRLLWKTAIKFHKQTRGDKTSLKRQKQHKEMQNNSKRLKRRTWESHNTNNTDTEDKGSSAVETHSERGSVHHGKSSSWAYSSITQGHLTQPELWHQSYLCARHRCIQSHLYSEVMSIEYFPSSCGVETFCVSIDFSIFQWCGWNENLLTHRSHMLDAVGENHKY